MNEDKGYNLLGSIRESVGNKIVLYSALTVMGLSTLLSGCKRSAENLVYETKNAKVYYTKGWGRGLFIGVFDNRGGKRVDVLKVNDPPEDLEETISDIGEPGNDTLKYTSFDPKGLFKFKKKYNNWSDPVDKVEMLEHQLNFRIYLIDNQDNIVEYTKDK